MVWMSWGSEERKVTSGTVTNVSKVTTETKQDADSSRLALGSGCRRLSTNRKQGQNSANTAGL